MPELDSHLTSHPPTVAKAHITELPVEILGRLPISDNDLAVVSRTCRFFNKVFTPCLYSNFEYRTPHFNPQLIKRFFQFIRAINGHPDLARCVQHVNLRRSRSDIQGFVKMVVPYTPAKDQCRQSDKPPCGREPTILYGQEIIVFFLKQLPFLMSLTVDAWPETESQNSLHDHIFNNLRHIDLGSSNGYSNQFDFVILGKILSYPLIETISIQFLNPQNIAALMDYQANSSTLRQLALDQPNLSGATLKSILKIPGMLQRLCWRRDRLSCQSSRRPCCIFPPNRSIRTALEAISHSVEHLDLNLRKPGTCAHFNDGMGSLCNFTSLKTLAIVPELLLGYENRDQGPPLDGVNTAGNGTANVVPAAVAAAQNPFEEIVKWKPSHTALANLLPDSLEELTLYTTPSSPAGWQPFWLEIVRDVAKASSRLKNLTHFELSHVCDSYCDESVHKALSNDESGYTEDQIRKYREMEDVCRNAGILLTGPWKRELSNAEG